MIAREFVPETIEMLKAAADLGPCSAGDPRLAAQHASPAPALPQVINLMEALQQSVARLGVPVAAAPATNGKLKKVTLRRVSDVRRRKSS